MLKCVEMCSYMLKYVAMCFNVLHYVEVCCGVLQCVTVPYCFGVMLIFIFVVRFVYLVLFMSCFV